MLDDAVSIKVSPEENLGSDDNFIYLFISYIQDTCCGKLSTMEDSIVFPFAEHQIVVQHMILWCNMQTPRELGILHLIRSISFLTKEF